MTGGWGRQVVDVVRAALIDKVERDHRQPDTEFLRRRIVVAVTLVLGTALLAWSFSTAPGDAAFYPLTFGLAATWLLGSVASGPLHLGHIEFRGVLRRPILVPIAIGVALSAVFVLGALIARTIPPLARYVAAVLDYAQSGNLALILVIAIVNGIAEEVFFRGALYAAIGVRYPVTISTIVYTLTTIAGGNPILVLAAAILGTVVGLQRRAGGGILAPALTHITWSTIMLFTLQPIFAGVS